MKVDRGAHREPDPEVVPALEHADGAHDEAPMSTTLEMPAASLLDPAQDSEETKESEPEPEPDTDTDSICAAESKEKVHASTLALQAADGEAQMLTMLKTPTVPPSLDQGSDGQTKHEPEAVTEVAEIKRESVGALA